MMKRAGKLLLATTLLATSWVTSAFGEVKDYNSGEFDAALAGGKAVVLDFHASWCPTCRAQAKAFESVEKDAKYSGVPVFRADYDKSDMLKDKYSVSKQSTLILFKGGKELDRTMGVSDVAGISAFIDKGL